MKKAKLWFSFVELIVVVSIIALISVIWASINSNYTERTKNSRITSDIITLKNSMEAYRNDNKNLPDPKWNQKFFDDSANYVHYDDPTAFWVYWSITEDTIPKKYLDNTLLDPRTNQYYAYGKTLTWWMYFEVAWVNKVNWNYEAKVVWDYTWETWPYNLIREYNWPDFVYDKSRSSFPYNPDERLLKAKIWTFNWTVKVNWNIIDTNWINNNELSNWDTIEVSAWWLAEIYYSDWSKSYLWDSGVDSKLTLANMVYKEKNNLYTKIQLALNYGNIWTKTSKLDPNSDFEIYTTDIEAAVRWTIFGVSKNNLTSTISVQTWSVEIIKLPTTNSWLEGLLWVIKDWFNWEEFYFNSNPVTSAEITSWVFTLSSNSLTPTSYTLPIYTETDWLENIKMNLLSMWNWVAKVWFPSSFSGVNMKIYNWAIDMTSSWTWNNNILTLSWLNPTYYSFKVCTDDRQIRCTKDLAINLNVWTFENGDNLVSTWKCVQFPNLWECVPMDESLIASGYTLVAFAPYDKSGDLNMYTMDWKVLDKDTKWIVLWEWENDNDDFSTFTHLSWFKCDEHTWFCEKDWVKWIFIWTWNYAPSTPSNINDYLKYDLSSLWIESSFAVEVGVRGGALNRSWSNWYFLFNSETSLSFKLLYLYPSIKWNPNYSINTQNLWLENNATYKVISTKTWSYNYWLNINWFFTWKTLPSDYSINSLYIWSDNNKSYEWNDIIDYIKIYK